MSKHQISKIYPGTSFINRKFTKLTGDLINKSGRCVACGTKKNIEPHHIIPCHVYDELFLDESNIAILCSSCHKRYHETCFPINRQSFDEFCSKKHHPKEKKKKKHKYKQKKYEPHPSYSKIKINDFRKKRPAKRKKKRKKKLKRVNPIFLVKSLGTDDWSYQDKIEIEKEVLGDYNEK